ncbi:MAG: hypothetical protein MK080_14180 [Opitutales bacterium]|nr:hypothetical protein [Opitutales bacterium]
MNSVQLFLLSALPILFTATLGASERTYFGFALAWSQSAKTAYLTEVYAEDFTSVEALFDGVQPTDRLSTRLQARLEDENIQVQGYNFEMNGWFIEESQAKAERARRTDYLERLGFSVSTLRLITRPPDVEPIARRNSGVYGIKESASGRVIIPQDKRIVGYDNPLIIYQDGAEDVITNFEGKELYRFESRSRKGLYGFYKPSVNTPNRAWIRQGVGHKEESQGHYVDVPENGIVFLRIFYTRGYEWVDHRHWVPAEYDVLDAFGDIVGQGDAVHSY